MHLLSFGVNAQKDTCGLRRCQKMGIERHESPFDSKKRYGKKRIGHESYAYDFYLIGDGK